MEPNHSKLLAVSSTWFACGLLNGFQSPSRYPISHGRLDHSIRRSVTGLRTVWLFKLLIRVENWSELCGKATISLVIIQRLFVSQNVETIRYFFS